MQALDRAGSGRWVLTVVDGEKKIIASGFQEPGWCIAPRWALGMALEHRAGSAPCLFSQIQPAFSSHGGSIHSPVPRIMTQASHPQDSLGSPCNQWLQQLNGGGCCWESRLRMDSGLPSSIPGSSLFIAWVYPRHRKCLT